MRGAFRPDGEPQAVRLLALSGGDYRAAFVSAFPASAGRCCAMALLLRSPVLPAAVLVLQLRRAFRHSRRGAAMPSKIWRRLCAVHEKSAVLFLKASGAGTARFGRTLFAPPKTKGPALRPGTVVIFPLSYVQSTHCNKQGGLRAA